MVWCSVVWCGVVWCGVMWCSVVWCGVMWCGVVWSDVVRCDRRSDVVRCDRRSDGGVTDLFESFRQHESSNSVCVVGGHGHKGELLFRQSAVCSDDSSGVA